MKLKFILSGLAVFILALLLGIWLLYCAKISGSEFVGFIIAFAMFGLVLGFLPEIQELSLGGNVVKFKEIKREAEIAIEQLKMARLDLMKYSLATVVGGRRDADQELYEIDPRIERYYLMVDIAEKQGIAALMSPELSKAAEILLKSVTYVLQCRMLGGELQFDSEVIYQPLQLSALVLSDKALMGAKKHEDTLEGFKSQVLEILGVYTKLFSVYEKYHQGKPS
ncbi:hypothetical protein BK652_09615 [Pseudomonas brassicacearum]|uniref:Uncharacterized protein n=1 Tax=Pseudomonas brassicacearum TaxID=930166 RepID=A0A423GDA8_9PSED|nr:hypothetical protein [Pseudomonas brassicacearum]ROM84830.1 hypothetical protein BK652_09615 [Pseudomonas brassicacearum]